MQIARPWGLEGGELGQVHFVDVEWVDVGDVPNHVGALAKSLVADITRMTVKKKMGRAFLVRQCRLEQRILDNFIILR